MLDAKAIETSILRVNNDSFTGPLIIGTFEKRAPGPEMRPGIDSGIVTRDAPVSHWSIFFPVPSNSHRSLGPVPYSFFECWIYKQTAGL